VEIKCQLDVTEVFIADLTACSACFGHHYAHHQKLKSIIKVVAACGIASRKPDTLPTAPHQTGNLTTTAPNTTSSNHLYNTLELLMMGIMVLETC